LGSGAISLSQSAATESKSGSNPANGAGWAAGFWSADHRVKWAVGANGAIARFTLVSSWTLQSSGVANDLLAGSAPSTNVCWVVGRDGVILRTTDGEHWGKLQSPVKVDFAAVAAESATAAIVTARDGHRFTTNDGGGSWHPL